MSSYWFTNSFAEAIFVVFKDAAVQYRTAGSLGATVVVYTTTAQIGHVFPESAVANQWAGDASVGTVLNACSVGGLIFNEVGGSDFDVAATVDTTVIDSSAVGAGNILFEGAILNIHHANTLEAVIEQGATVVSLIAFKDAIANGRAGFFTHGTVVVPGSAASFGVADNSSAVGVAAGDDESVDDRLVRNTRCADNIE